MSEINNLPSAAQVYPFAAVPAGRGGSAYPAGVVAAPAKAEAGDRIEISATAVELAEAAPTPRQALRLAKVARLRAEIQKGTYDVNGKLHAVMGRVLADVFA